MQWPSLLFLVSYLVTLSCTAGEIDWKKLALETDEPAYGHRIVGIAPDLPAEKLGLKTGDFIVQFGEKQVRNFYAQKPKGEHVVFFVKKGGKLEEAVAPNSNLFGYYFEVVSRPWIAYLRGEIGTASKVLEDEIVAFLIDLPDDPPTELRKRWEAIREKGYPEDELDAVIHAVIARRLDESAPIREAFEKVHAEFEVFPPIYFDILENLAVATNQTGTLRELYRLDPDSSVVYEDQIKLWDKLSADPYPAQRNLLKVAEELHDEEILADLKPPEQKPDKGPNWPISMLLNGKTKIIPPGRYYRYIGNFPKDIENVHVKVTFFPDSTGYHPRFPSEFKMYLEALQKPGGDINVSTVLANAGIHDPGYTSPVIRIGGGHNNLTRMFYNQPVTTGLMDVTDMKNVIRIREPGEHPEQFDFVLMGEEIAIYCNGVCYSHLPVSRDSNGLKLMLHSSGMATVFKYIKVWKLKPE